MALIATGFLIHLFFAFRPGSEVVSGVVLSLYGSLFTPDSRLSVTISGEECNITSANDTVIECEAPALPGGVYTPEVMTETGRALVSASVEYKLGLSDVTPTTGQSILCFFYR